MSPGGDPAHAESYVRNSVIVRVWRTSLTSSPAVAGSGERKRPISFDRSSRRGPRRGDPFRHVALPAFCSLQTRRQPWFGFGDRGGVVGASLDFLRLRLYHTPYPIPAAVRHLKITVNHYVSH
jgi:hypothetical protein